jgi:hypothetical protein
LLHPSMIFMSTSAAGSTPKKKPILSSNIIWQTTGKPH